MGGSGNGVAGGTSRRSCVSPEPLLLPPGSDVLLKRVSHGQQQLSQGPQARDLHFLKEVFS